MYNLLTDPLIRVRLADGTTDVLSLPEVLAALSSRGVESFLGLLPHQRHAWHAFLVQLSAIVLQRTQTELSESPDTWRELLRSLTTEYAADEPWQMAVEDLTAPAFLQPPVYEETLKGFKNSFAFPDKIDILVTSKSHDVKMTRIHTPQIDNWLYALVTLQTLQGYSGKTWYGISRMNGGRGNRPCVGIIPAFEWSARFRRDVRVLLDTREQVLAMEQGYRDQNGLALVWLEPWDGNTSLQLDVLDPYFIEICRRVRLILEDGHLMARATPTSAARLSAKEQKGIMGDPWTPIDSQNGKSLTISAGGFRYDKLQQILFSPDYQPSACQRVHKEDPETELQILASGMVRGDRGTEGLYECVIPIPTSARKSLIMFTEERDQLALRAKERVGDTSTLKSKALRPALLDLVQGGPAQRNMKDKRIDPWSLVFGQQVDDVFFPELWATLDQPQDEARQAWQRILVSIGENVLHRAEQALPLPTARRYRGLAVAERTYRSAVAKNFGKELLHGAATGAA
jgi:CRISPR system Cascade subunit CasA